MFDIIKMFLKKKVSERNVFSLEQRFTSHPEVKNTFYHSFIDHAHDTFGFTFNLVKASKRLSTKQNTTTAIKNMTAKIVKL